MPAERAISTAGRLQERIGEGHSGLCDGGHKALEAEDIEHTGEVVAERHQAPFAADLVEAANEEVAIAGAAFERAEGMLDDGGTTAHQVACAFDPRAMTFENILVLPATDDSS